MENLTGIVLLSGFLLTLMVVILTAIRDWTPHSRPTSAGFTKKSHREWVEKFDRQDTESSLRWP